MGILTPNLDILPDEQKKLFPLLKDTPKDFVLYGGTAVALRLGHRISVDFDFFSKKSFDPDRLRNQIPYLKSAQTSEISKDTLTCFAKTPGSDKEVKISYFGGLPLRQIQEPDSCLGNNILVASLKDLLGMKCATVFNRAEKKDYVDIHAILTNSTLTLADGLAYAKAIYGEQYNPLITLKALTYFEDGNVATLDHSVKKDLLRFVKGVNLEYIPVLDHHTTREIGDINKGLDP